MATLRKSVIRHFWRSAAVISAIAFSATGSAFAVTPEELVGDYTLTALVINYAGDFPPPVDEDDFTTVNGYFSATAAALVFEHAGQDNVNRNVYQHITAGRYQLAGSVANVARANGASVNVQISMPNENTVIVAGVGVDNLNQPYNYEYEYSRDAVYYTQDALDDAVESATEDLFTQQELDDAVASATEDLFTQQELDDAVADAVANVKAKVVPIFLGD